MRWFRIEENVCVSWYVWSRREVLHGVQRVRVSRRRACVRAARLCACGRAALLLPAAPPARPRQARALSQRLSRQVSFYSCHSFYTLLPISLCNFVSNSFHDGEFLWTYLHPHPAPFRGHRILNYF